MTYSDFRKGPIIATPVASGTGDNATNLTTTLLLNKDYLTGEYTVELTASQTFTVAPSTFDVTKVISTATLEFMGSKDGGNGPRIVLAGRDLYQIMRLTEAAATPVLAAGASPATVKWGIDIHLEADEARNDFMTAVWTKQYTQIKLTIVWAAGVSPFTNGTMTGNVMYSVNVVAQEMPVVPGFNGIAVPNANLIGTAEMRYMSATKTAGGVGNGDDMLLETGNKTRFIMLTADVAGVLDDGVVNEVYFNFGGYNFRRSWAQLQQENARNRGFAVAGYAVIDFGDDPLGWLPLEELNEARLKWTALKAGNLTFTQVSLRPLNGSPVTLA